MSNNDREELEKKVTNSQIEEVDELIAISDPFDNIIDELKALQLREYGNSEKRKKIKIIAEENQKRLQEAEELEQKKNKEEQAVQDNLLERQKPDIELNSILALKRQNVSEAYKELENAHQALESSNDFLIDATIALAEKELDLSNSIQSLNDLHNQLTEMSDAIKELQGKVAQLLPSAETIKSEAQSELKDTTEPEGQSALEKLNQEISEKQTRFANLSKLIEEQQEKCKQAHSLKDSAFATYTETQKKHQNFLEAYKFAFENYIYAVNSYNEGLESEQQLRIPEFKFKIPNLGSEKKENSTQLSSLEAYAYDIQAIQSQPKRDRYIKETELLLASMSSKISESTETAQKLFNKSVSDDKALLSNINLFDYEPVRLAIDNLNSSNQSIGTSFKEFSEQAESLQVNEQHYIEAVKQAQLNPNTDLESCKSARDEYLASLGKYESARDQYQAVSDGCQEHLVAYLNALENYRETNVQQAASIPNIQEELKKKEEESKKLSQEEKAALDRIAEAERFQSSSLSSQTSSSHKEQGDTGDLESTKSELKKLLQETTSKYDSTIKKLSDMNYSDPFLNAFLVGRLANVRIAKFCKENELKKLIRESETINPNDEQARVALRTRLNNFKSREECYNFTPLANLAEQGLQQIAGYANEIASYTNIYRAFNVMKSAANQKKSDQDDDKSLNQRNSQQLP